MTLPDTALDQLFRQAHTAYGFIDKEVPQQLLQQVFELARLGPTAFNSQPARFVFLCSQDARSRLVPALSPANVDKTRAAPVTVIVAHDTAFHDFLPQMLPQAPQVKGMFEGDEKRGAREATAFRNGSLQGAYFMLAARALGLACGPMSGFDAAKVDAEFFPDGRWRSNFLVNLGYADAAKNMPRNPRHEFSTGCQVL
jgi:3-hydroxypropanoate dehydrogenase